MNREDIVEEFHLAMENPVNVPFSKDLLQLRKKLIEEEVKELFDELDLAMEQVEKGSVNRETFENMCKEMADVQYALSGLAISFGLPMAEAFELTHQSNMSKLGPDGKPIKRSDGKVIKGPNYHKPDLSNLKQNIKNT